MEVPIFFHERNERYQMHRKFVGVPSTFGRHCIQSFEARGFSYMPLGRSDGKYALTPELMISSL